MAAIVSAIGALPLSALLVLVVVGPWLSLAAVTVLQTRRADKEARRAEVVTAEANTRVERAMATFRDEVTKLVASQEKRFEAVVRMYENNVKVVDDYHSLASDLTGIITLSTRTLEGLVQKIDNNQFCPNVRKETGKR
jgi:hypothetical protein